MHGPRGPFSEPFSKVKQRGFEFAVKYMYSMALQLEIIQKVMVFYLTHHCACRSLAVVAF